MTLGRFFLTKGTILAIGLFLITGAGLVAMSKVDSKKAAKPRANDTEARAEAFLDLYDSLYVGTYTAAQEAQWLASTDVTPEHDGESAGASKVRQRFLGDRKIIETARGFLAQEKSLEPLTARRLRFAILAAAEGPGTIPKVPAQR